MLALEFVAKPGPVTLVLPARIGHHPIKVVERARDQKVLRALCVGQRSVDRQAIFPGNKVEDCFAVANGVTAVDDVGQLPARRFGGVEDVVMLKGNAREFQEGEYLEPVAVVVGDSEQGRIGVEGQHGTSISSKAGPTKKRPMKLRSSAFLHARVKKSELADAALHQSALDGESAVEGVHML